MGDRPTIQWTGAAFSPCSEYRYKLERIWRYGGALLGMIGFNPSTADAFEDDPTIRRCIGFAHRWGFDGLVMLNLFALRSTDPKAVKLHTDPAGPLNLETIRAETLRCDLVVCAWGALAKGYDAQVEAVSDLLYKPAAFSTVTIGPKTKDGFPRHPLYLKSDTPPHSYWNGEPLGVPAPPPAADGEANQ